MLWPVLNDDPESDSLYPFSSLKTANIISFFLSSLYISKKIYWVCHYLLKKVLFWSLRKEKLILIPESMK